MLVSAPLAGERACAGHEGSERVEAGRDLEGKTALVTGSGRNLGRAILIEFAARGANVVVNARSNRAEAEAVAEEARALGADALVTLGDVGDADAVQALVGEALRRFSSIDIYVSNAATRPHQSVLDVSAEDWRRALATNLDASFHLAKAIAPSMVERGWGRIIHIGGGFGVAPGRLHTLAGKAGLLGLTKALAADLGRYGITANLVAPAALDVRGERTGSPPRSGPDAVPAGRWGTPEDVAWTCAFLASERSGFITGQTLHVNGGRMMR